MNVDVNDFIQQMKQVIRDENLAMESRLEQKLEQKLEEKLDQKLAPIKQEIEDIKLNEKKYEEIKIDESIKDKVQQGIIAEEKHKSISLLIAKDQNKKGALENENTDTITNGKALKEVIEKLNKDLEENEKQYEVLLKNVPGDQDTLVNFSQLLAENEQKYSAFNRLNEEITNAKNEIQILNNEVVKGKEEIQKHDEELEKLKYAQK